MDLNDKLIKLKHFRCVKCNLFLYLPVMHKGDTENVCGYCYEKQIDQDEYLRNTEIEEIIKFLTIPCRYNCPLQLRYNEMIEHEEFCLLKTWDCSSFGNGCSWSGTKTDILNHVKENHKDSLIESENFQFQYNVIDHRNIVRTKFLLTDDELFLLRIHVNYEKNNMNFVIYHINENYNDFKYHLEVINFIEHFKLKQKMKINIGKFDSKYNLNNSINFDVNTLPRYMRNNVQFLIEISESDFKSKLDYEMLSNFECSNCFKYLYSCIHQCSSGHNICRFCYKTVDNCPACDELYGGKRNRTLEKISLNIFFPCRYQENGCKVVLKGDEIGVHDNYCSFQLIDCPQCGWRDISFNLIKHFFDHHNVEHTNKITIPNKLNIVSKYLVTQNNLFKIVQWRESRKSTNWVCIQMTGNDKYDFKYEITFDNANKKLVHKNTCFKYLPGSSWNKNVLKIDESFMKQFPDVTIQIINVNN